MVSFIILQFGVVVNVLNTSTAPGQNGDLCRVIGRLTHRQRDRERDTKDSERKRDKR